MTFFLFFFLVYEICMTYTYYISGINIYRKFGKYLHEYLIFLIFPCLLPLSSQHNRHIECTRDVPDTQIPSRENGESPMMPANKNAMPLSQLNFCYQYTNCLSKGTNFAGLSVTVRNHRIKYIISKSSSSKYNEVFHYNKGNSSAQMHLHSAP